MSVGHTFVAMVLVGLFGGSLLFQLYLCSEAYYYIQTYNYYIIPSVAIAHIANYNRSIAKRLRSAHYVRIGFRGYAALSDTEWLTELGIAFVIDNRFQCGDTIRTQSSYLLFAFFRFVYLR